MIMHFCGIKNCLDKDPFSISWSIFDVVTVMQHHLNVLNGIISSTPLDTITLNFYREITFQNIFFCINYTLNPLVHVNLCNSKKKRQLDYEKVPPSSCPPYY